MYIGVAYMLSHIGHLFMFIDSLTGCLLLMNLFLDPQPIWLSGYHADAGPESQELCTEGFDVDIL